ncbi:hypothetical protein [Iamia sp.]|uniref:hypothetical protein n=1 Tax=Iamia sp. TaxID=2722710 RepID=UPI002C258819|nr:hypothetical protein [Iamia sp.]HXH55682.1 hypothetical protein [Iamia sp.]
MASVAVGILPIVVATVRAAGRGWEPVGDNAYFLIRARDVFTEHHPLLGTWTSASQNTDTNFNNPGPLLFDLLAIPAKLGGGIGLAIGVALLNVSALVGVAVVARRRGGPLVGMAAVAVTALLCSSMGSQLLFDPWQPHSLLLPFLFTMTTVWAMASGDHRVVPWAVGVASLIVQTHLSYVVLLAALGGWGVVGLGCSLRRARSLDPDAWPALRRSVTRVALISVAVLAVCWIQPLIENVTAEGQGNIVRLATNATSAEESVGVALGTRVVADTLTVPPFWLRPSFEESLRAGDASPDGGQISSVDPSFPVAALLLGVLGVALVAAAWDARRRADRVTSAALSTAAVALAAGLVTAWQLPFGVFGVAAHQFRWMWPVGAFIALALLAYVLRRESVDRRRGPVVAPVMAAVIVVVAVSTLPTYNVGSGPSLDEPAIEVMHQARPQMAALEGEGTLLIDFDGIRFAEPYTGPVMAELQRRGIPFVVEDTGMVRQLGESRRLDGDAQRLLFRDGDAARVTPPGARRVVFVEGLTEAEQDELDGIRADIADHIVARGLGTEDLGDTSLSPEQVAAISSPPDIEAARQIVDSGLVARLIDNDLVVIDDGWHERFARYAELQDGANRTMALFLAPLDPDEGS